MQAVMASCIDQMRDARITLYELDPAGVSSSSETMDANGFVIPGNPFENQVDFDSMVKTTGEMALHGQNDVDRQIVQAVRNGENFYTLSYRPRFTEEGNPKNFRAIQVQMGSKSLIAMSREGYYATPPELPEAQKTHEHLSPQLAMELASAISGLMVFDGLPLTVSRSLTDPNVFHITFPATALNLQKTSEKSTGDVLVIALSYDMHGRL
jgi:hypothetical protein